MKKLLLIFSVLLFSKIGFSQIDYKHDRITVFKDGTVFFEKSTVIDANNKSVILYPIPYTTIKKDESVYRNYGNVDVDKRIIMGTLRFSALENEIEEVAYIDTLITNQLSSRSFYHSVDALLNFNIGKEVNISYVGNDEKIIGTILGFTNKVGKKKVIIKVQDVFHFINVDEIKNVHFKENPLVGMKNYSKEEDKAISIKFAESKKVQTVNFSYLQKGITWIPNYYIDILDDNNALLKLEANLVNDIENIDDAEFNFVVGVPSFHFSYVNSPMSTEMDILQLLAQLSNPPKESQTQINPTMSQRGRSHNANYNTNYKPQLEGRSDEDLFFYKKEKLSIQNNSRILVPIFQTLISYDDIFSVQLETNVNNSSMVKLKNENIVWHAIKFKNTAEMPLTTGSVFFNKSNNGEIVLLSQNIINYTPVNENAIVNMTVSPDIDIRQKDIEIKREKIGYDKLLTVDGIINITNYKSKPITIEINRIIKGDLLNSNKKWEYTTTIGTSSNKSNSVTWSIRVPTGGVEKIKYKYTVLVD